jgi:neutral amino acid transport system permease protein
LANFAHGDFMTLGADLTLVANTARVNIGLSIFIGAIGTKAAMLLSEKLLWPRMCTQRATSYGILISPIFASVILGGIGNSYGAIAAAFIIGISQEVSTPLLGS